jgi:stage II sporulation protein M
VPHGITELPAIALASAAGLRMGAIITRPPEGKGIGEAWLMAMGDWLKVFIGLVLPLLLVSAVIEVYITPQAVLSALGR